MSKWFTKAEEAEINRKIDEFKANPPTPRCEICKAPLTEWMQDYCSDACEMQAYGEAQIEKAILIADYQAILGV